MTSQRKRVAKWTLIAVVGGLSGLSVGFLLASGRKAASVPAGLPAGVARAHEITAVEERDQQIAALRASGPDSPRLVSSAEAVGAAWEKLAVAGGDGIRFGSWECHRAGCFTSVVHRTEQSIEDVTEKILASREYMMWPGARTRSGPIHREDG